MAKEFLGKGWKFPVGVDGITGQIAQSEAEQDIREAIWLILSTAKGERVMRPDFGCGIHEFVFAALDVGTIGQIESSVHEALLKWEPRIQVLGVQVSREQAFVGKVLINIDYRVRTTNNQFNLVYPFYLSEG